MDTNFLEKRVVMVVVVLSTAAMMVFPACDDEDEQTPEEVATEFLADLRSGQRQAAMDSIWPPTRRQMEETVDKLEEYVDDGSSVGPADTLVVTRLESPFLFASVDIDGEVPADPDHGEETPLTIEYRDGREAAISLRWSDDDRRWYVDLPLEERRSLNVSTDEVSETDPSSDEDEAGAVDEVKLDSMNDEMVDDE